MSTDEQPLPTDLAADPSGRRGLSVLVVGAGGREHALVIALARDPSVGRIHAAPGNPGMASIATTHPLVVDDPDQVAALARDLDTDLVVIGPEAPLVAGVADVVRGSGIACFGPSRAAALLEGSKSFAKEVMAAAGVPTAGSRVCTSSEEVAEALDAFGSPFVVKDDGLAAGKGVVVTSDRQQALDHAASCARVVVEEFLDGPEFSVFALCDGERTRALAPAQDFKRIYDGGRGPNTGGMGAYSPLPWAPADIVEQVERDIVLPTLAEMSRRGTPFRGALYVGLALTLSGPRVIEFNCRFGDPDVQPVLARLRSPLAALLLAAADGSLDDVPVPEFVEEAAVSVVMASAGYPEGSTKGVEICGADQPSAHKNAAHKHSAEAGVQVVHAGTAIDGERLVTAGGRVLSVIATGRDVAQARERAYARLADISFEGAQWRRDIAAEPLGVVEGAVAQAGAGRAGMGGS